MNRIPVKGEIYSKIVVDTGAREGDELNDYYNNCIILNVKDIEYSETISTKAIYFKFESYYKMFEGELLRIDGYAHPKTAYITEDMNFDLIP